MKHRYKIAVDGTSVREYYEFDLCHTEDTVRDIWLSDVEERWGPGMVRAFKGRVDVTMLTDGEKAEITGDSDQ